MTSFQELLETCERAVRSGEAQKVGYLLRELNPNVVPLDLRLPLANVARRAGFLQLGLKLLSALVREDKKNRPLRRATPAERVEYAVILLRSGAALEARERLQEIDANLEPGVSLYLAFCYFNQWNYENAIPHLESYIERQKDPYLNLVGRVNLAAALIVLEQLDRAFSVLDQNIEIAKTMNASRLLGNSFEQRAQANIRSCQYVKAKADLEIAHGLLSQDNSLDTYFVKKWRAVLEATEVGSTHQLQIIRQEALEKKDWESVREADLFLLSADIDEEKLHHLYIGTPYLGYRERVKRILAIQPSRSSYLFGDSSGIIYDVASGELNGSVLTKPGQQMHRILGTILHDLYRPKSVASLFAELFKGEKYDVYSSPGRVHQALFRFRQWAEANSFAATIVEAEGVYILQTTGPIAFRLDEAGEGMSSHQLLWRDLKKRIVGETTLTSREISQILNLSSTSTKRFLAWAISENHLVRYGSGMKVYYRQASPSVKAA